MFRHILFLQTAQNIVNRFKHQIFQPRLNLQNYNEFLTCGATQISKKSVWKSQGLELDRMNPFIAVVGESLVLPRPYSAINKAAEAVFQGCPFPLIAWAYRCNSTGFKMEPPQWATNINIVQDFIGHHTQNRNEASEIWHHITASANPLSSINNASIPSALLRWLHVNEGGIWSASASTDTVYAVYSLETLQHTRRFPCLWKREKEEIKERKKTVSDLIDKVERTVFSGFICDLVPLAYWAEGSHSRYRTGSWSRACCRNYKLLTDSAGISWYLSKEYYLMPMRKVSGNFEIVMHTASHGDTTC